MKQLCLIFLAGLMVLSACGCNTTRGAGEDIENTGRNIQETVDKNQ